MPKMSARNNPWLAHPPHFTIGKIPYFPRIEMRLLEDAYPFPRPPRCDTLRQPERGVMPLRPADDLPPKLLASTTTSTNRAIQLTPSPLWGEGRGEVLLTRGDATRPRPAVVFDYTTVSCPMALMGMGSTFRAYTSTIAAPKSAPPPVQLAHSPARGLAGPSVVHVVESRLRFNLSGLRLAGSSISADVKRAKAFAPQLSVGLFVRLADLNFRADSIPSFQSVDFESSSLEGIRSVIHLVLALKNAGLLRRSCR